MKTRLLLFFALVVPALHAQDRFPLFPNGLAAGEQMGDGVSISGSYAAISSGTHTGQGRAVYVYRWTGAGWEEQARLTNPEGYTDQFGKAVAISDTWLAVGSSVGQVQYAGEVYLFRRDGAAWTFVKKLRAPDANQDAYFGNALGLDGDRLVVGAYAGGSPTDRYAKTGSAYVFERNAGGADAWGQTQKLNASDYSEQSQFGFAVALEGNTLVVGAPQKRSAYVFEHDGSRWVEVRKWTTNEAGATAFGVSVALDGARALVGASGEATRRGAAYLYERGAGGWPAAGQRLLAFDGTAEDNFGYAVALEGDLAVVTAPYTEASDAGAFYVFKRGTTTWENVEAEKRKGNANSLFGTAAALAGKRLVVGARGDDQRGTNAGGAYGYVLVPDTPAGFVATDGNGPGIDRVGLRWLDAVGEAGYRIYRDGSLIATPGAGVTSYNDDVGTDRIHTYAIEAYSANLGASPRATDIGRTRANGRISGDVKAGATGVPGVLVAAAPYLNQAAQFDGTTQSILVPRTPALTVGTAMTVEAWVYRSGTGDQFQGIYSNLGTGNEAGIWGLGLAQGHLAVLAPVGYLGIVAYAPDELPAGAWHHVAYAREGNTHRLYVDGAQVAEETVDIAFGDPQQPVRIGASYDNATRFSGRLDEVRLWNVTRTAGEIAQSRARRLAGDESGLAAYWRFDESAGAIAADYTTGGSHGLFVGTPTRTTDAAPVALGAYTNVQGAYSIREVSYGTGRLFTVTPTLDGHGFDPARRENVELNPTTPAIAGVNFADTTAFVVSGRVFFAGTPCAAMGVDILVGGVKRGSVRADGTYEVTILNPGTVTVRPDFAGHTFEPAERLLTVVDNLAGIDFNDTQTYTLEGKAVGGDCNLALGADGRVDLTITGGGGCLARQVTTDASGQYAVSLPALAQLSVEASVPNEPTIQFTSRTVSLRDSSQTVDFVYRSRPEITLAGFPANAGQCGIPVLEQLHPYSFTVEVNERYGSQTCAVENGLVIIRDDIADRAAPDTLRLQGGQAYYAFTAGNPNIVGGGLRAYQKLVQAEVVTGGGPEAGPYGYRESLSQWAVVEGSRPRAATFATVSPQLPLFVLHDPPGDKSYSYIARDESTCTTTSFSALRGGSVGGWGAVKLGTEFEAGLGFSVETSIWGELKNTFSAEKTSLSTTEQETCFTANQKFSTSDDEYVTAGTGGDVFVGAALNMIYAITDDLDYNEAVCRADLSKGVAFGLNGFATEYTYTESFVRENLVPRLEMLRDLPATPRDSVAFYDNQIKVWKQTLALNEKNKATAAGQPALVNRSFDGNAGPIEESQTLSSTTVETVEFNVVISDEVAVEAGLEIGGSGLSGGASVTLRKEDGGSQGTRRATSSTTGYVLDDDDYYDFFSVDIKADPVYGTPLFALKSGTSACVWEPGTQPREGVQLTANTLVRNNVSPDGAASFQLTLGNTGQSDEARAYQLFALSESNPDGAVIAVNGFAIGDLAPVTIAPGASVNQTLTVRRGPEAFSYPELKIGLRSTCDPYAIADTLALAVHFQNTCSPVTLAAPAKDWVVNRASTAPVRLVIRDYVATALTNLKIQYAPVGTNSWQTVRVVAASELPEGFFQMDWDTRGLPDGAYQVRVAVECAAGTTFSEPVAGFVDRTAPAFFGLPEPADGFWQKGDVIRATFSEALDPTTATADHVSLMDTKTGASIPVQVQYADRQIIVTPDVDAATIEGAALRVTLAGLKDLRGNMVAAPLAWQFRVQQSPVAWSRARLALRRTPDALDPEAALLRNAGAAEVPFEITRHPAWATPAPLAGRLAPGDEEAILFTFSPTLAAGTYRDTVVAQTPAGPARLVLDLDVSCPAPAWQVDPAAFAHAMNVTAGFYLSGAPFSSSSDRVAALVGGEVRGVATVQPRVPQDDFLAFLTVYSNSASGEEVHFELWDASECRTMEIAEPIAFEADASVGSVTTPARLSVSGAVLQTIGLMEGVTWISLGVEAQDMAAQRVLGKLRPAEGDRIQGQTRYSQYVAGQGWVGTLDTLRAGVLYKVRVADPQPLPFIGQPVAGKDRPLAIADGWNWLGYLPDAPLPLPVALASLTPSTGDLLRSQTAFAQFDGSRWQGSLATMTPGAGYLLKSKQEATLTYPDAQGVRFVPETVVAADGPDWQVDAAAFERAMTVTATLALDGLPVAEGDARVAAFVGAEVRGVATPVYVLDRWVYFLPIYGNTPGEVVTFKAYRPRTGTVETLGQQVAFADETALGTPREPFALGTGLATGVDDGALPDAFALDANAPNPFTTQTTIRYALPQPAPVVLEVYDLLGRRVLTLVEEAQPAGRYAVRVEAGALASGVYVYRLHAGSFTQSRRMVVVR